MSFESGLLSYSMFKIQRSLPGNVIDLFSQHAAPPIETLGTGEISGWVTGRHLLDRNITEDSAIVSGYLRLTLMKASRIIPPALLRAECKMEELAECQAKGLRFLKRNERASIKAEVTARLMPTMPPTLQGIDLACDPHDNILYATATTEKQIDALRLSFRHTTGIDIIPLSPDAFAAELLKKDIRDCAPTSFSPEQEDRSAEVCIGRDFLTWLWFYSEACGGMATMDDGTFGVAIEGPLCFMFEGSGAHETSLRNGQPLISAEAKTALINGKKLKKAKLLFARDDVAWKLTLDADTFTLRSVQLPPSDSVDAATRFQERLLALDTLRRIMAGFYERFLNERLSKPTWDKTRKQIHDWVTQRRSKA